MTMAPSTRRGEIPCRQAGRVPGLRFRVQDNRVAGFNAQVSLHRAPGFRAVAAVEQSGRVLMTEGHGSGA